MRPLRRLLGRFLLGLERDFTTFRKLLNLRRKRPYEIVPYLTYGTQRELYVRGRVIEDKGLTWATPDASRWRNLSDTFKRFVSDEVPGARLRVAFPGGETELQADARGYFRGRLALPEPVPSGWCEVSYTLLEPKRKGTETAQALGFVLVPGEEAQFGVISDIDDTVVQTDVTRWVRVLGAVLFGNAHTRLPFRGVAAFYRALEAGTDPKAGVTNPLFYVSSSPWNLYDLLLEFLALGNIPLGPLNLRAWRSAPTEAQGSLKQHGAFKGTEIRRILDTFPELSFILIGDSGEEDPEIYGEIVSHYPGRILAVYIRNVSGEARSSAVHKLGEQVKADGSKLVLADDTLAAAQHALTEGWIEEGALEAIRVQKERDTAPLDSIFFEEGETVATVIERNVRARSRV